MSISKPNLAQVGDYLNGMPPAPSSIQQLDKWSKGANPEIPGWAAAGALQQKTQEMSQQKNAQGATTGPMPTIIDQLRQKAAMVEQQRQQQAMQMLQAMQAQQQQGAPGIMGLTQPNPMPPASAGVTPQMASSGVSAAEGGLMQLPVNQDMFNYAEGGVIGCDGTGASSVSEAEEKAARKEKALAAIEASMPAEMSDHTTVNPAQYEKQRQAAIKAVMENFGPPRQETYAERDARMHQQPGLSTYKDPNSISNIIKYLKTDNPNFKRSALAFTDDEAVPAPTGYTRAGMENDPRLNSATTDIAKPAAAPAQLGGAGGIGGAGKKVNPVAAPAGVASLVQTPHAAQMDAQLAKPNLNPSTANTLADERALMPELLNQPYMADARKRIEAEDARRKEQLQGRGKEHLLDVLNGIAYGGFGAAGIAHRNATQKEQASDAAHNAEINKMLTELDKGERGEASAKLTSRMAAYGEDKKAFSEAERNKLTSLATIYGVDQRAFEAAAHNLTQLEVAKIQSRAKPGEQLQLIGQYLALKVSDPAKAKAFLEGYRELNESRTGRDRSTQVSALKAMESELSKSFRPEDRAQLKIVRAQLAELGGIPSIGDTSGNSAIYNKADAILGGK